jgi:hypothetical protein
MGWWTALKGTMGTRRADRIGRAEADQLLAGLPAGHPHAGLPHAGLARLLSEASAPARAGELSGEAEAVREFRRLRSAAPSIVDVSVVDIPPDGRRRTAGPPWRGAAMRLALVVLLLAIAGTASFTLGYRSARMPPSPTQVPSSSVPAPKPSPPTPGTHRPAGSPAMIPSLAPSPASFAIRTSDLALATQLCQVWTAAKNDKAARDRAAAQLKPLIDRLDGPNGLPAFCMRLVDTQPTPTTKTTTTTTTTATTTTKAAKATPAAPRPTKSQKAGKGG